MALSRIFGFAVTIGGESGALFSLDRSNWNLSIVEEGGERGNDGSRAEVVFRWPDVGTFRVQNGRDIRVDVDENADHEAVRNIHVGICFGTVLLQRGFLVFHGSVVSVDGDVVAFVGNKGSGKSTSAAALLTRGHEFLSDDIVAVRFDDGGRPMVRPGFPLFKFDPDTFDHDGLPASPTRTRSSSPRKTFYRLDGDFDREERPLSRICLLAPNESSDESPRLETLTGHDALMGLLEHSWPVRLRTAPYVDKERSTLEGPDLDGYAQLVERCTIDRIGWKQDHESLEGLGRDLESLLGNDDRPVDGPVDPHNRSDETD